MKRGNQVVVCITMKNGVNYIKFAAAFAKYFYT